MRVDPIHVRAALSAEGGTGVYERSVKKQAAVAVVLQVSVPDTRLLLIRRAERPGDPWSGHMALPGGHTEPEDVDLRATAIRETYEEVGLRLDVQSHLGALPSLQASARGVPIGTMITPHVFTLAEPAALRPNQEVADVFWVPIGPMARGQYDDVKVVVRDGRRLEFPAIRIEDHLVWGLTHRMLSDLFRILAPLAEAAT